MRTSKDCIEAPSMLSRAGQIRQSPYVCDKTVPFMGVNLSNMTFEEMTMALDRCIASGKAGFYIVTPNVDHLCRIHRDADFRDAYEKASLAVVDGKPIVWATRLFGRTIKEKLSGSDLVPKLSKFAAAKGYRVFYFGAAPGVAESAANKLKTQFPDLMVAGTYSPPMSFDSDPQANAEAIARIKNAGAQICFVAMGAPRQEIWMRNHARDCNAPVMIGIGAGLDFAAGRVKRAPRWMQYAGLEWLWRLCVEPRRLWRRYLVEDLYFFRLLWREFFNKNRKAET